MSIKNDTKKKSNYIHFLFYFRFWKRKIIDSKHLGWGRLQSGQVCHRSKSYRKGAMNKSASAYLRAVGLWEETQAGQWITHRLHSEKHIILK